MKKRVVVGVAGLMVAVLGLAEPAQAVMPCGGPGRRIQSVEINFAPPCPSPRTVCMPAPRCGPMPSAPIIRYLGPCRRLYQVPGGGHPALLQSWVTLRGEWVTIGLRGTIGW